MNVGHLAHSQLLQRNTGQLDAVTSVQEKLVREDSSTYKPSNEKIQQITDSMNTILESLKTSLRFQFHDKLGEYYVTVVNNDTNEVVKEIPPKKMLDLYASIEESIGIMVDQKI
ncbi:flagellar protein FlaG [Halobacillus litoralis]|uniref:flagellar protein FlaG n=1 Tax=Halobacillus litoralis TaxID=45668 RepID=UPI001CFD7900|nr:flagellar protein FlaG [Halobacillus litoralis]